MTRLGILLLSTGLDPKYGGPFVSVSGLARGLANLPHTHVTVLGCSRTDINWQSHQDRWGTATMSIHEGGVFTRLASARKDLLQRLCCRSVSVVHASGLWDETTLLAMQVMRHSDVPVIWSVRGMLEPWTLTRRQTRKRLAWAIGQRRALYGAAVVHATADSEAESCRRAGLRQPIAVIPNGLDVEPLPPTGQPASGPRPRRCVYLGRLHPKKGLPNLISAWARCDTRHWELVIAGPDSGGYADALKSLVRHGNLANVRVVGPVYGHDRTRFLEDCELFVCPSYSENFGNAIAEAMERGKPVITTTGTPWEVLESKQMGWWVAPETAALGKALSSALRAAPDELRSMGLRCREHVSRAYSWPVVVRQMRAVYEWMMGGDRPDCLFDDANSARSPSQSIAPTALST
jgi:glycosyltransferase involved in cell wall biosynthesis